MRTKLFQYIKIDLGIINAFKKIKGGLRDKKIFKQNSYSEPLITIITVVLNNDKYLQECLDNFYIQKYRNYEHIIIDGGSTDNTLKILEKNNDKIDLWVSEKDEGIYDAFNKGMSFARGQYIGFLNSDDIYYSDKTLNYVIEAFNQNQQADFIFGPVKKHWALLYGYKPWKIYFTWGFIAVIPLVFLLKLMLQKMFEYNLKYKYSTDYDYFFRMIVKKNDWYRSSKNKIFGIFRKEGFQVELNF